MQGSIMPSGNTPLTHAEQVDRYRSEFANIATGYYVSGRLAAQAQLVGVHGNLLHHAIEMYLKAALVRTISIDKLASKGYGHNLKRLWTAFKQIDWKDIEARNSPPIESRFDQTISDLDMFWDIRYPDKTVTSGQASYIAWSCRNPEPEYTNAPPGSLPPPRYQVVINEVDCLVIVILGRVPRAPATLLPMFTLAKEALLSSNPCAHSWISPGG